MSDEPARADWSTYDVAWLTGATYRQLDYWIRTAPASEPLARHARTGSGSRRRFTDDDVRLVDLIVRLIGAGVARELARHLASSIPTGEPINRQLVPGVFLIVEWRSSTTSRPRRGSCDRGASPSGSAAATTADDPTGVTERPVGSSP